MELHERLISFLGKPENNPQFQAFLAEMNEQYQIRSTPFDSTQEWQGYYFDQLGFWLHVEPNYDVLFDVAFSIRGSKTGDVLAFKETLPHGITRDDRRKDVQKKLGGSPFKAKTKVLPDQREQIKESYQMMPYVFDVSFAMPQEKLISVAVTFADVKAILDVWYQLIVCTTSDIAEGDVITKDLVEIKKLPRRREVPDDKLINPRHAVGRKAIHSILTGSILAESDLE